MWKKERGILKFKQNGKKQVEERMNNSDLRSLMKSHSF